MSGGPNPPPPDPKNLKDSARLLKKVAVDLQASVQVLAAVEKYLNEYEEMEK